VRCVIFLTRCHQVEWADLEQFDPRLADEIQRQFYVLQDFLLAALRSFIGTIKPDYVVDDMSKDKVFQLAFKGVHPDVQLRDLKTCEIGKLISIVGTVTRTGDVRPELINGTFLCLECRAEIRNVLQQFKYVVACRSMCCGSPATAGTRSRSRATTLCAQTRVASSPFLNRANLLISKRSKCAYPSQPA
jgi:DNA replicative helicase MCM subunit Mcm2 (Cdc46/Mcm family)